MTHRKALCLNMIVRNETANLERCLAALGEHIACWIIGDTGSTDGTQDFIRSFFAARNLPGELHEFPFHDFEQARNAALDHAYASPLAYDYLLFADADMELVVDDPGFRANLTAPGYRLLQRTASGLVYWNTRLVRRDAGARYHGVTHEYIDVPGGTQELRGARYKDHATGANRVDKFERDIRLLTEALAADPDNVRTWFYLAQSYRDAGRTAEAAETYAKRAAMGGFEEEAWYARLQHARCLRTLGDEGGFLREALRAFNQRPQRAEPLYDIARFYRERGMNDASVLFCEPLLAMQRPADDLLFLEDYVYTAGIREEYSIAANYARDPARKARGHAACNWLALSRDVPDATRDLARSNLYHYAEQAAMLMPSFAARPIGFTPPDGYRATNPSVACWAGQIMLIQRSVNYTLTHGSLYQTRDNAPIHTRNFLLRLNGELAVEASAEILPPLDLPPPAFAAVQGFEDARLFAWRGALWCTATVRQLTPAGWCEQVLARIDPSGAGAYRLSEWRALRTDGPPRHEKNWMPLVDADTLHFVYLCDPTRIVDDQLRVVSESVPPIVAEQFRGGTQAIAFAGGWLALIHESEERVSDPTRAYHHRFVWFDAAHALRGVSRRFHFNKPGIEFAAGLAWHPDGRRLMISYGVDDSETWLATVEAADVRSVLDDVMRLPSGAAEHSANNALRLSSPKQVQGGISEFTAQGRTFRFFVTNRHDSIMQYHYAGEFYEQEELAIIARHARGGIFVDVGANVGNHAIYLSRLSNASRIILFEPNPVAIEILRINLLLNACDNIDPRYIGTALGASDGRMTGRTPDPDNLGGTMFTPDEQGTIPVVPGDSLLLAEPITFIKLDVEGMEMEILAGLRQTITRWRPVMFIEVWESRDALFAAWCEQHCYFIVETYRRYTGINNYLVRHRLDG